MLKAVILMTIFLSFEARPTLHSEDKTKFLTAQLIHAFPKDILKTLYEEHLSSDKNFQAAILYLQSEEWKRINKNVHNVTEWVEYKTFLKNAGLDLDYFIQHFTKCINNINSTNITDVSGVAPSFTNFINDVKLKYGMQFLQIMQKIYIVLKNDEQFKKFALNVRSLELKKLLQNALEKPALITFIKKLEELLGVDVKLFIKGIFELLSMPFHS